MANLKGCFLHTTDHWSTPIDIYDFFIKANKFFDPCPLHSDFDGLNIDWYSYNFVNPPYSDIITWVKKAIIEIEKRPCVVVFLVPARTDIKWFHLLFPYVKSITFIKGRLKFGNSLTGAPFPSILIYCGSLYESHEKLL